MGLVVVHDELKARLDALTTDWTGDLQAGLLKGTQEPQRGWTMTQIRPAVFGGYGGTQPITNWKPATLVGDVMRAKAGIIVWNHDGTPGSCFITGWYAIGPDGKLRWAELFPEPWRVMAKAGDQFRLEPRIALRSQYPIS